MQWLILSHQDWQEAMYRLAVSTVVCRNVSSLTLEHLPCKASNLNEMAFAPITRLTPMPSDTPTANRNRTPTSLRHFPLQTGRLKTEGRVLVQPQILIREHPNVKLRLRLQRRRPRIITAASSAYSY